MIQHFNSKQFLTFLATGGFAAVINFGSRFIYNQWMDFSSAVLVAYLTGMITAFILAKLFVFKTSARPISHSAFIFTLVNLVALLQTWGISVGLSLVILPSFAHAIGIMVPAFTSYLGHKFWTFKAAA